jgi:tetratricopeptide (TPR) repeat protein
MPICRSTKPILLLLILTLTGCGTGMRKDDTSLTSEELEADITTGQQGDPVAPLTPDVIFNILTGEIALQRQQLDLAYERQLEGARLAGDAKAAERAARIAIHQRDYKKATVATSRWVELSPEDPQARTILVLVHLMNVEMLQALEQSRQLVALSERRGEDGYLHVMAAVVQSEQTTQGLEIMRQLVSENPEDARAVYALALVAVMAKEYELAETEVRRALKMQPDMIKAHVLLARILVTRKDFDGAKASLEKALWRFPDDKILNATYARLLVEMQLVEPAYKQFKKMRRMVPNAPEVHLSLGVLSIQMERLDRARGHLDDLLRLGKKRDDACYYLGRVEELDGNNDTALEWYQKVGQGERWMEARTRMISLLAKTGDMPQALAMIGQLRKHQPRLSLDLYLLEGELLNKHATPAEVEALYERALQAHKDDPDLLYARAIHASNHGKIAQAERDLQKIIKKDPKHADALNALGYTLADKTTRYKEALGYIQQALALKPDSAAILDSMGWVQFRLGKSEQALHYLRKAFDKLQDAEIAAHLGEVLWSLGDRGEARQIWKEALKEYPESDYLKEVVHRLDP